MSPGFRDFTQFLTLISFVALLLLYRCGQRRTYLYTREIPAIAILRCLGVKAGSIPDLT